MGLFKCNKDKKRLSELKESFGKLQVEYEENMSEFKCSLCKCFKAGAVSHYTDRFISCTDCKYYEKMQKLAKALDDIGMEIDALEKKIG